jgi:hypothetical protein
LDADFRPVAVVGTLSFARALALTLSRAQSQPMRSYFDHEKLKVYQEQLLEIVSMLMGLINSLSARIQEDAPSYLASEHE